MRIDHRGNQVNPYEPSLQIRHEWVSFVAQALACGRTKAEAFATERAISLDPSGAGRRCADDLRYIDNDVLFGEDGGEFFPAIERNGVLRVLHAKNLAFPRIPLISELVRTNDVLEPDA